MKSARILAAVVVLGLLAGCAGFHPVPYAGKEMPLVRVLLTQDSSLTIIPDSRYELRVDGKVRVRPDGNKPVRFFCSKGDAGIWTEVSGKFLQKCQTLELRPLRSGARFRWQNGTYRGSARIFRRGNELNLVNALALEDYLKGVVPAEIGKRAKKEFEALKAQAVAARTFVIGKLRRPGSTGALYDLRADVSDQVYKGSQLEYRLASMAVEATTGEVITYRDSPIHALFHSTCGGRTEYGKNVFPNADEPYLKGVADNFGEGDFCKDSPHYRWIESLTFAEIGEMLRRYGTEQGLEVPALPVTNLWITRRYPSGRVKDLVVLFGGGAESLALHGNTIRWVIRQADGQPLRSTLFKMLRFGPKGHPEGVLLVGAGNGHGVGMCQWGAIGMARQGFTYRQILAHYYRGTSVKKLY